MTELFRWLLVWGPPLAAPIAWYIETDDFVPVVFALGSYVWFGIWTFALVASDDGGEA